jgi:thiol-disulfide isomerase/thioredoxin
VLDPGEYVMFGCAVMHGLDNDMCSRALLFILILCSGFVVAGCKKESALEPAAEPSAAAPAFTPRPAPAWALKDFEGNLVHSTNCLGNVVVLDFWATWCPPCRQEIPGFIKLQQKYGAEGLVIIGVDVGPEDSSIVKQTMKNLGINYLIVAGDDKIDTAFGGVEALPTTFIIDRSGQIVARHLGYKPETVFESEIKPLLQKRG